MNELRGTMKRDIASLAEKNRIVRNIVRSLEERDGFLLIGHKNPDEDCIAAMVAFGLLASKLSKTAYLYFCGTVHEQFSYLLTICTFNSITVIDDCGDLPGPVQAVVAFDTPKPEMLEGNDTIRRLIGDPAVVKIEIDHHLGADSSYFGDEGYSLVALASSASELVGLLALKMEFNDKLKARYQIREIMTRNVVLAVLTGIIGDSHMGKYLKTKRERWFYERFSSLFDRMLAQKTRKDTNNFTSKEEVFDAIASLSTEEEACYRRMMRLRRKSGYVEYVILPTEEADYFYRTFGNDTMTQVAKAIADTLAEEGGHMSLVAYPDSPEVSNMVQFRVRRSQSYTALDLRAVLEKLAVSNGGGHPGAVGFRFEKAEVPDIGAFAEDIVAKINAMASGD